MYFLLQKTLSAVVHQHVRIGLSTNKIAVYTAIFGGYEGLLPQRRLPGVDYICFSDRPVQVKPWMVHTVEKPYEDPTRCARMFKILPHQNLAQYDYSIWIDGNYLVVGDINSLIAETLAQCNMAYFDHSASVVDARNCVYDEYASLLKLGKESGRFKDAPEVMEQQIKRYRSEGYPAQNGLIFSSVLVRRHNENDVATTMNRWWSELSQGSKRDQLSFNYAAWRESLGAYIIHENVRNNRWFFQIGIHRKNYRWKLLRYRLKRLLGLRKHS